MPKGGKKRKEESDIESSDDESDEVESESDISSSDVESDSESESESDVESGSDIASSDDDIEEDSDKEDDDDDDDEDTSEHESDSESEKTKHTTSEKKKEIKTEHERKKPVNVKEIPMSPPHHHSTERIDPSKYFPYGPIDKKLAMTIYHTFLPKCNECKSMPPHKLIAITNAIMNQLRLGVEYDQHSIPDSAVLKRVKKMTDMFREDKKETLQFISA